MEKGTFSAGQRVGTLTIAKAVEAGYLRWGEKGTLYLTKKSYVHDLVLLLAYSIDKADQECRDLLDGEKKEIVARLEQVMKDLRDE